MTYLQKRTHTCTQLKRKTIHWNNEIINSPFEGRDIVFYEKFTKLSYHLNSSYPYVSYDTNIYKFCLPPFPNDHSTYSWGWVESQGGGGNIFINSSWSCQLGVEVISHQCEIILLYFGLKNNFYLTTVYLKGKKQSLHLTSCKQCSVP